MKTRLQWLRQLPEDIYQKALANFQSANLKDGLPEMYGHDDELENMKQALAGSFHWEPSPEGFDYWHNVLNEYNSKNNTHVRNRKTHRGAK
ncbi:MAG: hypothetical protein V4721_10410 [Bacteroidota bacterium]